MKNFYYHERKSVTKKKLKCSDRCSIVGGRGRESERNSSGLSKTSVGSDPGTTRRAIVLGVFECLYAERHPEEEERENAEAEDEKDEEGDVGEEAVHETKLRFAVILKIELKGLETKINKLPCNVDNPKVVADRKDTSWRSQASTAYATPI